MNSSSVKFYFMKFMKFKANAHAQTQNFSAVRTRAAIIAKRQKKIIIIIHYLGDLRAKIQQYGRGYVKIKYGVSGFLT